MVLPPHLPAWRTRADRFDDVVLRHVERLEKRWKRELDGVEFAVEDVPPSDPAPWERHAVALGRYFPADRPAGLTHRIVIYRRPVESRCADAEELDLLVGVVVVDQVAAMLGRAPEDVDPEYPPAD